jgi:hypothetical protein
LIANLTLNSCEPHEEELEDQEEERRTKEQDGISPAEKVDLWNLEKPDVDRQDDNFTLGERNKAVIQDEEEQEDDYAITHFPDAWAFLTGSRAYEWLLARMKTEMLLTKTDGTQAENIKRDILKGLASVSKKVNYGQVVNEARFDISWDLPGFLKIKYPDKHEVQLGSLITIVGIGYNVQALTCAQYINQVWPVTGVETLSALQEALDKGAGQNYKGNPTFQPQNQEQCLLFLYSHYD